MRTVLQGELLLWKCTFAKVCAVLLRRRQVALGSHGGSTARIRLNKHFQIAAHKLQSNLRRLRRPLVPLRYASKVPVKIAVKSSIVILQQWCNNSSAGIMLFIEDGEKLEKRKVFKWTV